MDLITGWKKEGSIISGISKTVCDSLTNSLDLIVNIQINKHFEYQHN
jgi:hypothetical protein